VQTGPYTVKKKGGKEGKAKAPKGTNGRPFPGTWTCWCGAYREQPSKPSLMKSAKHPSLVPGPPSADYRLIRPEHLDGKILYILKSPREYRVWLTETAWVQLKDRRS
jgi:hypothetical protein